MNRALGDRAWRHFVRWCRARGLRPLPAHPWTVAAYARWCEPRNRFPVIVKRLKSIARVHVLDGRSPPERHPTVTRTLRMIETRTRLKGSRAALFRAEDFVAEDQAPLPARPRQQPSDESPAPRARFMRVRPRLVRRRDPRPIHRP
ncbi:MAG TPA: hypothetical protein QF804_09525 [Rhodospirillales bacterium]|nr:hypothetical protein [Rhodospirillales bacterium]HJO69904.1 hypothetical protein [Rhodospirillales bacterium]